MRDAFERSSPSPLKRRTVQGDRQERRIQEGDVFDEEGSVTIRFLPPNVSSVSRTRCSYTLEPTVTGMLPSGCASKASVGARRSTTRQQMKTDYNKVYDYNGWQLYRKTWHKGELSESSYSRTTTTSRIGAADQQA